MKPRRPIEFISVARTAANRGQLHRAARILDMARPSCWSQARADLLARQARDLRWAAQTGCSLFYRIG